MKLALLLILCFPIVLSAQENELDQFYESNYQPSELNTTFTSRFNSIYPSYLAKKNVTDDKNDVLKDFVLNYNYFLDKLNKSGEIFYDDEISIYLNELKDTLLFNHAEKDNITVYLTNFNELNAFTNDFGNVYVNVGLIAKMNSADELLTVLAHEISHVILEHSYKQENKNLDLDNGRKVSEVDEIDVFESHKFSRKQELEADSLAFELLKSGGFDLSAFEDAFELLRHSKNPIHNNSPGFGTLCFNNDESVSYLKSISDLVELQELNFELDSSEIAAFMDSIPRTHPTIDQRVEYIQLLLNDDQSRAKFQARKDFQAIKLLASKVYLKKLADEGNYIEGLYLVCKLREASPTDDFLIKMQLKHMLLLTQSKYQPRYASQILNEHGNECDNENYLRFRWAMLQVPAVEMNIITILSIKNAQSSDPYLKRLEMLADQFLYKNNRFMFQNKNGKVEAKTDINFEKYLVDELSEFYTSEEVTDQKENIKMGYQYVHQLFSSNYFVNDFLANTFDSESFSNHVQQYRSRRDDFNKNLTLDRFILSIHPDDFKKAKPKGDFIPSIGFSGSKKSVLARSDTYSVNFEKDGAEIDILQTAKYNEMISTVIKEKEVYESFQSNQANSKDKITVKDNYTHYVLNKYVNDCWSLSDLTYSSVDEEVQSIISEQDLDYVSYNLNMIIRDKTQNKTFSVYYSFYFDLHNMGVTYFSKMPNRSKPSTTVLRSMYSDFVSKQNKH